MAANRIGCLDGLRGFAAIWVLLGHALLLSGWRLPIISRPDLAVDLFMMLSGFLMAFHYIERQKAEPWHQPRTWVTFWTRRFFRIAPLYYVLLAIALIAGPALGAYRDAIASAVPGTATVAARYLDQSWENVVTHVTFIFGFHPYYGFSTALPDWSIGLEMAFYAALPFIMAMAGRIGFIFTALALALGCSIASVIFKDFFGAFNEPSFLLIKLPIFLGGMLVAAALSANGRLRVVLIAVGLLLCLLPVHGAGNSALELAMRFMSLGAITLLVNAQRLPPLGGGAKVLQWISQLLGSPFARFLGESSYGVYLLHLLVMIPTIALTLKWLQPGSRPVLFLVTIAIVVPVTYAIAWALHLAVEKPGIQLGRRILSRFRSPSRDHLIPATARRSA
jgi:peptidoglycan/LPS O-acetylase OafA/YrhL